MIQTQRLRPRRHERRDRRQIRRPQQRELSVQFDDERVVQFLRARRQKGLHLAYARSRRESHQGSESGRGSSWWCTRRTQMPDAVAALHHDPPRAPRRRHRRRRFGLERAVKNAHNDARNSSLVTRLRRARPRPPGARHAARRSAGRRRTPANRSSTSSRSRPEPRAHVGGDRAAALDEPRRQAERPRTSPRARTRT